MKSEIKKFKDLDKGVIMEYNGHYAVKFSGTVLHVTRLGVDGYIQVDPEQEFEVETKENV